MDSNINEKLRQKVANKLRDVRLGKGLKQSDVAEKAGINSNYYAKVERAEVKPSIETLEKICRALKIKSSDILPF